MPCPKPPCGRRESAWSAPATKNFEAQGIATRHVHVTDQAFSSVAPKTSLAVTQLRKLTIGRAWCGSRRLFGRGFLTVTGSRPPRFAVRHLQHTVGLGVVKKMFGGRVPTQLAAEAISDVAQMTPAGYPVADLDVHDR